MTVIPWYENLEAMMTETQYRTCHAIHILVILIYFVVTILAIINFWQILIKQKLWKALPLLFFYIFTFLCIFFRICILISYGLESKPYLLHVLFTMQPISKIFAGLLQSWIIFELAVRIRASSNSDDQFLTREKSLMLAQKILVFSLSTLYIILLTISIITATYDNHGDVLNVSKDPAFSYTLAFMFLFLFILMCIINLFLMEQIKNRQLMLGQQSS